jgi:hypothetical protein
MLGVPRCAGRVLIFDGTTLRAMAVRNMRTPTMTIRAPHFAFRYLGKQLRDGREPCDSIRDVEGLVSNMVEVQNDRVRLSAIHARGSTKMLRDDISYFGPQPHRSGRAPRLPFVSLPQVSGSIRRWS